MASLSPPNASEEEERASDFGDDLPFRGSVSSDNPPMRSREGSPSQHDSAPANDSPIHYFPEWPRSQSPEVIPVRRDTYRSRSSDLRSVRTVTSSSSSHRPVGTVPSPTLGTRPTYLSSFPPERVSTATPSGRAPAAASPKDLLGSFSDTQSNLLREILTTLQKSNIVSRDTVGKWDRFWTTYKKEANEYDAEFVDRYWQDMESSMVFAGLFSAVVATVASMTLSDLSPDADLVTQALLNNILVSLSPGDSGGPSPVPLPSWNGPPISVIWVQCLLYASLACGLFAALGAVLGKQWLKRYDTIGDRGSIEDRCKERQRKLDGLEAWHFRRVMEVIPILLQAALLLFILALCAWMWNQQRAVAAILIITCGTGVLFYSLAIGIALAHEDSPYHTSVSDMFHRFFGLSKSIWGHSAKLWTSAKNRLLSFKTRLLERLPIPARLLWLASVLATRASSDPSLDVGGANGRWLLRWLRPLLGRGRLPVSDAEAIGSPDRPPPSLGENAPQSRRFSVPYVSDWVLRLGARIKIASQLIRSPEITRRETYSSDRAVVLWLLQTSSDPLIHSDALQVIPEVDWPQDTVRRRFTFGHLELLFVRFADCFQVDVAGHCVLPVSEKDAAMALASAFLFVYWEFCTFNQRHMFEWVMHWGRSLVKNRSGILEALAGMVAAGYPTPDEAGIVFAALYLTLGMHFDEVRLFWSPVMHVYHTAGRMSLELVCARSFWSLAHVSTTWQHVNRCVLVDMIGQCQATAKSSEARHIYFMALAVVLGFKPSKGHGAPETFTIDQMSTTLAQAAAEYFLKHLHLLMVWWKNPDKMEPPWFCNVLELHHEQGRFVILANIIRTIRGSLVDVHALRHPAHADQWLYLFAHLANFDAQSPDWPLRIRLCSHILHLSVNCTSEEKRHEDDMDIQPIWNVDSFHFEWLIKYMENLLDSHANREATFNSAVDAFIALSCIPGIGLFPSNDSLARAISWALHVEVIRSEPWEMDVVSMIRLQYATMRLVHSIVVAGFLETSEMPTLSQQVEDLFRVAPRMFRTPTVALNDPDFKRFVLSRDLAFMDIVRAISARDPVNWVNSKELTPYFHEWLAVIHRWMVIEEIFPRPTVERQLLARALLDCTAFRERLSNGEDDLGLSWNQQVGAAAAWSEWRYVVQDSELAEYDWAHLIKFTMDILKIRVTATGNIRLYFHKLQQLVIMLSPDDEMLFSPVQEALQEKLEAIASYEERGALVAESILDTEAESDGLSSSHLVSRTPSPAPSGFRPMPPRAATLEPSQILNLGPLDSKARAATLVGPGPDTLESVKSAIIMEQQNEDT
ncbi:hypothetical protein EIP91_002605 [Steccherinum ochraceum]|uniref:DUF6535 domain-containing protein n=1 Tax=Steccherinum ochraceum TaxID=92696 RepID=A0A4R0RV83_9APHY|nr:hypothetical protein EIP91_002605 [Steccherinum ochraceum]